jgi:hypothetical protein
MTTFSDKADVKVVSNKTGWRLEKKNNGQGDLVQGDLVPGPKLFWSTRVASCL